MAMFRLSHVRYTQTTTSKHDISIKISVIFRNIQPCNMQDCLMYKNNLTLVYFGLFD